MCCQFSTYYFNRTQWPTTAGPLFFNNTLFIASICLVLTKTKLRSAPALIPQTADFFNQHLLNTLIISYIIRIYFQDQALEMISQTILSADFTLNCVVLDVIKEGSLTYSYFFKREVSNLHN